MATLTSVQSGLWSSGSTWDTGNPPAAGDQVVIASGHTVIYDVVEGSSLDVVLGSVGNAADITINGTLQFNPSATQPLRLRFNGYIRINTGGKLICGTNDNPMPVKVTIRKETAGYHLIYVPNPNENTEISFVGSPNLPYDNNEGRYKFKTKLASAANQGATQITVTDDLNWQVGDYILMPRVFATEVSIYIMPPPFEAQVTAVNGNTLTLSSGLPHNYPQGAPVVKATRSILLYLTNPDLWYHHIFSENGWCKISGFKWVFLLSFARQHYCFERCIFPQIVEYTSVLPSKTASFYGRVQPSGGNGEFRCHVGTPPQSYTNTKLVVKNSVVAFPYCSSWAGFGEMFIEDSDVWNFSTREGGKFYFKNCQAFAVLLSGGFYYLFEDCTLVGLGYYVYTYPEQGAPGCKIRMKNCIFDTYRNSGYTFSTQRNRFDWGDGANAIDATYIDCEFRDSWIEPYSFVSRVGHEAPRVKFVNKKVGNTIIKVQEFQAGGIISSDETMLPPDTNVEYTLKFEPRNPNLPIVYDGRVKPREQIEVWFYRGTGIDVAKVQIVELVDEFVANPLDVVPLQELDLTNYTAGQWHRVVIHHALNKEAILRFIVKGSAGSSLWVACSEFYEPALVFVE